MRGCWEQRTEARIGLFLPLVLQFNKSRVLIKLEQRGQMRGEVQGSLFYFIDDGGVPEGWGLRLLQRANVPFLVRALFYWALQAAGLQSAGLQYFFKIRKQHLCAWHHRLFPWETCGHVQLQSSQVSWDPVAWSGRFTHFHWLWGHQVKLIQSSEHSFNCIASYLKNRHFQF